MSHVSLPFQKEQLIEWILKHQQVDGLQTRETILLSSRGKDEPRTQRSVSTSASSTRTASRGGYRDDRGLPDASGFEPAHSPRSGRFDPQGSWEKQSAIYGSGRKIHTQYCDEKHWHDSDEHKAAQRGHEKAALEQLRRINNVHKTEKQQRLLRKVVSAALMGGDPLPAKDLEILVDAFRPVRLTPGDVVIQEGDILGDKEPGLFVLESGSLGVYKGIDPSVPHDNQNRQRYGKKVHQFSKVGATMGELSLHYGAPRSASILAESDDVLVWSIARVSLSPEVKISAERRRKKSIAHILAVPILAGLGEAQARKLLDYMDIVRYRRGDPVISQGQIGNTLFILEQGNCLACRARESLSALTLRHYKSGDYFGELALLQDVPRAADVIVESQAATLLVLDRNRFTQVIGQLAVGIKRHPVNSIEWCRLNSKDIPASPLSASKMSILHAEDLEHREAVSAGLSLKQIIKNKEVVWPRDRMGGPEKRREASAPSPSNDMSKVRPLGTTNAPKPRQQEELLRQMLETNFFGACVPAREELIELAGTFLMHRIEPGTVLVKEGQMPQEEEPLVFMVEFGDIGVYKIQRSLGAHGRPASKDHGVRITYYNQPGEFMGTCIPINHAPPTATLVADNRCGVVSMSRVLANQMMEPSKQKRLQACMKFMKKVDFLDELDPQELLGLVDVMGTYHFQKGDFVCQCGEVSSIMFIIEKGSCYSHAKGKKLKTHEEGDYLSEMALIEDTLRSADIVVDSDEAILLGLQRADFNRIIGKLVIKIKNWKEAPGKAAPSIVPGESGEERVQPPEDKFSPPPRSKSASGRVKFEK